MHKSIAGKRRAVVTNTQHKGKMMKAQIRLAHEWDDVPDEALPWAEYLLPIDGAFVPTIKGDIVWVEFPYDGDTRRPLIIGAAQDWAGGIPNLPPEASGQGGQYQPPAVDGAPAPPALNPTTDFVSKRNGLLAVRSAGGGYAITRVADGTTISMNEAGEIFINSASHTFINVGGNMTAIATGNVTMKAGGVMTFKAHSMEFEAGDIAFKKGG